MSSQPMFLLSLFTESSSTIASTIDPIRISLVHNSEKWFNWASVLGAVVALGCVLAAFKGVPLLVRWWRRSMHSSDPEVEDFKSWHESAAAFGMLLLAIAIIGEIYLARIAFQSNAAIHSYDQQLLANAKQKAASAKTVIPSTGTPSAKSHGPVHSAHSTSKLTKVTAPQAQAKATSTQKRDHSVKNVRLATDKARVSTKKAVTPSKTVVVQTKRAVAQTKRVEAPTKRAVAPTKRAVAQAKSVAAPTKRVVAPTKKVVTPAKKISVPTVKSPSKAEIHLFSAPAITAKREPKPAPRTVTPQQAEAIKTSLSQYVSNQKVPWIGTKIILEYSYGDSENKQYAEDLANAFHKALDTSGVEIDEPVGLVTWYDPLPPPTGLILQVRDSNDPAAAALKIALKAAGLDVDGFASEEPEKTILLFVGQQPKPPAEIR